MAPKSQPVGTPVDPRSPETTRHAIEPSGPRGDNPATAGPGPTSVRSDTPENAEGHLRPSPEDVNSTPGTTPEK
ncbi:hypothetical protein [Edaphobacter aggregans]|uniref:hypothetical protein n=1 Tax=Edaphobacter aggregans TaxID=570835 RepID=UPI0005549165|nr:hypothetical protein [Edaphobacter aggregans]